VRASRVGSPPSDFLLEQNQLSTDSVTTEEDATRVIDEVNQLVCIVLRNLDHSIELTKVVRRPVLSPSKRNTETATADLRRSEQANIDIALMSDKSSDCSDTDNDNSCSDNTISLLGDDNDLDRENFLLIHELFCRMIDTPNW
jgi:hypothetical protein